MSKQEIQKVSKHFHKTYIGVDKSGKEVLGAFLTDGREIRIYVDAEGKEISVYIDGTRAVVQK